MLKGEFVDNYLLPTLKVAYGGDIRELTYINCGVSEYVVMTLGKDFPSYQLINVTATSNWGIISSCISQRDSADKRWLTQDDFDDLKVRHIGDKDGGGHDE